MATAENIALLFEKPTEPVFVPKGDRMAVFDVPDNFVRDRYRPIALDVQNRFMSEAGDRIPVKNIELPDISDILSLGRRDDFSIFNKEHERLAAKLITILLNQPDLDALQSASVFCRDQINPQLFNYALSVVMIHREDTMRARIPPLVETFPEKFLDSAIFQQAREETRIVPSNLRRPIIIPKDYSASDLEPEHRLYYFREDIGVNLHHWHWHLVYPGAPAEVARKDRRGELFFYMHSQIIARYNTERLCNSLARVKRLNNFREAIGPGYFPKMDSLVSSRAYPPRQDGTALQDLNRVGNSNDTNEVRQPRVVETLGNFERSRDRIFQAIHAGFVVDRQGNNIPLTEETGIDILGNIVESASSLSINPQLYGSLHNTGHDFIAYCHDPDLRFKEKFGVMGDVSTAMRDPAFYMWHGFIEDLFQEYKGTLPPYTVAALDYRGVRVTGASVGTNNTLGTFWQQSDLDLQKGMDFTRTGANNAPAGSVFVRFTHLQHEQFSYTINVTNDGAARNGTVRIFMAPKNDERGLPWLLRDQRLMMIEMDRFVTVLQPGENTITRRSDESSVTIPFERSFRALGAASGAAGDPTFNFCGCGWPDHMLLPKGTPQGYPMQMFVMVSNYQADRIDQDNTGLCSDASSFCGIRSKLYPDRRAMGYPFDRLPRAGAENLASFLTPNMIVQDVTIQFADRTEPNPKAFSGN